MVIERIEVQLRMVCLCGFLLGFWQPRNAVAQTQELSVGDYRFTIPAGMKLERATVGELTTWPIVADWDQHGRLLVVESGGVSKPIEEHNKQLLHRVVRLEDTDGDGVFDSRTLVAKDLPFMEGVLCIGNDLLVTAPPHIYRLQDADNDGVCETRELWFDGQTITGCANDLHGPFLGRDGWIYWCKGAFAEQRHELLNGSQLVTNASHIFRRKLSGGAIEPVMAGGMDNPVEVAITPEGERFFTSTFLHHPGNGLRDGVAHAVYGGLYGKEQRAIEGHVRTGALMPVMVNLGAAAPSGLLCLESNHLFPELPAQQRTLVAALFNLQKVTAHTLAPQGGTFTTQNVDLVVGDRVDFHPTDVIEDADGSLLIIDTGGWYNLCCPSSRVDQQTAAGGIYRLSRELGSAGHSSSQLGERSAVVDLKQPNQRAEIVRWLCDARPWVARHAQLQLATLHNEAADGVVQVLAGALDDATLSVDQKLKCLWGLCTIGNPGALQAITQILETASGATSPATGGRDPSLLQAACHALSLHRFSAAQSALLTVLRHPAAHVRRTAAEALGRLGNEVAADGLLSALPAAGGTDRHQQHSVTYALIELKAADVALAWLDGRQRPVPASAEQKLVAMIAVEQLGHSEKLTPAMLLDGLSSKDENLRRTSSEILARHPQWGAKFRESIYELFAAASLDVQSMSAAPLTTIVAGWRETPTVQAAMTEWLSKAPSSSVSTQDLLLQLLAAWSDSSLPAPFAQPLANWMSQAPSNRQQQLAQILVKINLSQAAEVRDQLLAQAKHTPQLSGKLQFLACLPTGTQCQDPQLEQSILDGLRQPSEAGLEQPSGALLGNSQAAEQQAAEQQAAESGESNQAIALRVLQRVQLSLSAGQQLISQLTDYPPRILPIVIEALARVGNDELDAELLSQLKATPAARTLSEEQLLNLYRTRSPHLRTAAAETVAHLTRPPSDIEQKLDEVLARLTPGDPVRGLQLFRSNKTACSGCHRLGYVGGEIGPNLTKIGSTRTRRAILEAILFPSARLEQSYQPTKILTHDGQVYNGLITKHLSPTQFELQLTADKSLILSTHDVAEQEASQLSIMPSGLAELLTPEELSDLMAILESAK
jgi:putative membrane-bound dehydrogenase-like protein